MISPHFDDAVLSLGGTLAGTGDPLVVVTAHGGAPANGVELSEWDQDCGFDTPMEAYLVRRAEDARCCEVLDAAQQLLPNADGPYRPAGPLAGLDELVTGLDETTELLLPVGTNQPDHRAVRDQALAALARMPGTRPRVLLYADLPYSAIARGWGADDRGGTSLAADAEAGVAFREVADRYGLSLVTRIQVTGAAWATKRAGVLCHASQLSLVGGMDEVVATGQLLGAGGPLRFELLWELESWSERNGATRPGR